MRLAVFFPGIGYHCDKPLLYYSRKLAAGYGFEITEVSYEGFRRDIRGSEEKMREAFENALMQAEQVLEHVTFNRYETVLFVSKSIGTAVAGAYDAKYGIRAHHIFYTPVEASLPVMQNGIVFHGTADPWADAEIIQQAAGKRNSHAILMRRQIIPWKQEMCRTTLKICRISWKKRRNIYGG